jgi:hypothetical protein
VSEAHDQASIAVEVANADSLEPESFVERDRSKVVGPRIDHGHVGTVVIEDAAQRRTHCAGTEAASPVAWRSDPDVK